MDYIKNHIPTSTKRLGTKITPLYLTIHSTGNPSSTAANERAWLTNSTNTSSTSWHICVDESQAVEAVPLDEIAHHAGNTQGNRESIGIEICESGDRLKTIANGVELTADMLYERSWGIDRLKRHYDWSGKSCPAIFMPNDWQGWKDFKTAVALRLAGLINESEVIEMTQEQFNEMLAAATKTYNTVDEVPGWATATIQKLIDKKLLYGDSTGLNLTEDQVRTLVINDRTGLYD